MYKITKLQTDITKKTWLQSQTFYFCNIKMKYVFHHTFFVLYHPLYYFIVIDLTLISYHKKCICLYCVSLTLFWYYLSLIIFLKKYTYTRKCFSLDLFTPFENWKEKWTYHQFCWNEFYLTRNRCLNFKNWTGFFFHQIFKLKE